MAPLIGRQDEVDRAWVHLGAPMRGARVVSVEGQAGQGKTSLLAALVERFESDGDGGTVIGCALTSAETALPWAGVAALCRGPLGVHLAELTEPQRRALERAFGRVDGVVDPTIVASAVAALLGAALAAAPVVLVLDDLHWLDAASAGAMAFAVRANATADLRILAAVRPGARPLDVERLLPPAAALRLALGGLSPEALQDLLAERFGVVHRGAELRRLHDVTGGNPLYAIELGRQLGAGVSLDEVAVPGSLDSLIAEHLTSLGRDAQDVVGAAALMARPTATLLANVLGQVEDALLAAELAGVVVVRGDAVVFTHPLLRAGVLQRLPGIRRRQLARLLAAATGDPDEHARLRSDAAVAPDDDVAALLDEAGARAFALGTPHVAIERFERAVELGTPGLAASARRQLHLGRARFRTGDVDAAAGHFRAAIAAGLPPEDEVATIRGLAIATHLREGVDATLEMLTSASERADITPSSRYRLLWTMVYVAVAWDLRAAEDLIPRVVASAAEADDDALRLEAALMAARVSFLRGQPVDLQPLLDQLGPALDDDSLEPGNAEHVLLTEQLCWSDRRDLAIAGESTELRRARAYGNVMAESNALASLSDALRRAGRWDEALAALQRWAETVRLQGSEPTDEGNAAELAWLLAARGELAEATRLGAAAVEGTKSVRLWHVQTSARAGFVALVRGDVAGAIDALGDARDEAEAVGLDDLCSLPFRDDLVEALVLAGRTGDATAEADRIAQLAERSGRLRGRLAAHRARALVDAATGALAAAELAVTVGLELADELGDPFEQARLLLVGGVIARRSGRRTESRDRLDGARRRFQQVGAAPFVDRVDAELARLGDRTGQRDHLTHTERQVAVLVAGGRSNGEVAAELFVTPRTVEAHLTRIYRKLGLKSRAELIARRGELGLG